MNLWHDVPLGDEAPQEFNTIVEIPKGSTNKYEIDKKTGLIKLDRVSYTSQFYPFDYGFAPQTLWHDGDALDIILLTTYPLLPGILVNARPVGAMLMVDSGESDDKILAVPTEDPRYNEIQDIDDVNQHTMKEAKHFFETYKMLQGKEVKVNGFVNKEKALEKIKESIELYKKKFSK